jgi:peptidoglycan/xylan/chitin deacetylase (PgdA/CDA1 family)
MHRRFEMPATFFITGKCLENSPDEYRELLSDPLFEIASHSYSHKLFRNHDFCGPAASTEAIRDEIVLGKEWVERVFERPCTGIRPGCSFPDGLKGAPNILELIEEAGYHYVSSMAWGQHFTLPAPLNDPFTYAEDGFPTLWELPTHGWHENLLKDNNRWGARRIILFPPYMPQSIPHDYIKTADEEFDINNKIFVDEAIAAKMLHVSLIWHPWSLYQFDPEMRMLELTFQYVRELGMACGTYADLLKQCQQQVAATSQ